MKSPRIAPVQPTEEAIVTTALARASGKLGLPNRIIGATIGLSEPTVSRLKKGNYTLKRHDKEFELSVLFLRMYRSLTAIVGGDDSVATAWLKNYNTALGAKPVERIQTVAGLMHVITYLDARRAVV